MLVPYLGSENSSQLRPKNVSLHATLITTTKNQETIIITTSPFPQIKIKTRICI